MREICCREKHKTSCIKTATMIVNYMNGSATKLIKFYFNAPIAVGQLNPSPAART